MASDRESRREQRYRQLGSRSANCRICGEKDPFVLTGLHPSCICYECHRRQQGRRSQEAHHFAGRRNLPLTVPALGNDHRILSDMQRDWPETTLRNPHESPLLRSAGALRGWLDIMHFLIDRGLAWIPPFLEAADAYLVSRLGPNWWHQIETKDDEDVW
jgi:hypothetical protein